MYEKILDSRVIISSQDRRVLCLKYFVRFKIIHRQHWRIQLLKKKEEVRALGDETKREKVVKEKRENKGINS